MLHIRELPYRSIPQGALSCEDEFVWLASDGKTPQSRYSYLCLWPFSSIITRDSATLVDGAVFDGDPLTAVQRGLSRYRLRDVDAPVPFIGGACGFLGYHLSGPSDHRQSRHGASAYPDMALNLYDLVYAQDHEKRRSWILSSGFPEEEPEERAQRAIARADALEAWISKPDIALPPSPSLNWGAEQASDDYCRKIKRIIRYIEEGDIFQANLTMRFLAATPPAFNPVAHFLQRREQHNSPFCALLKNHDVALASFSPERFLQLSNTGHIETRPIKGSAPRGQTALQDQEIARKLANSEKDRAENLMIADLMRNDLGRVAKIGSVKVSQLHAVETFSAIHHLVSVIEAQLLPGLDAIDLLRATFPGGSITGAPKIRAMEIIDELEPAPRGAYCGSIGWLGFEGAMDTSITIRTLVATPTELIVQAGGAIVADSDPQAEYEEVLLKASPLVGQLR